MIFELRVGDCFKVFQSQRKWSLKIATIHLVIFGDHLPMSIDPPCVRKKLLVEDIEIHHVSWSKGMCYQLLSFVHASTSCVASRFKAPFFTLQPACEPFNHHFCTICFNIAPCQVLQYVHGRTHFHFLGVSFELCTLGAREFSLVFLSMEKYGEMVFAKRKDSSSIKKAA